MDIARAIESGVTVIRADVSGRTTDLLCCGSSAIVDRDGAVRCSLDRFGIGVIAAEIGTVAHVAST